MKGDLRVDGGDGCTTMWMYLTPLNCALKVVNLANFMYILPQLKKIFFQRYPFQEKWKEFFSTFSPHI